MCISTCISSNTILITHLRILIALVGMALGLLIGGSVSNLADRIRNGYVTDFIHITHWPTFNLADTFIVIGVALLVIGLGRAERPPEPVRPPGDTPGELI